MAKNSVVKMTKTVKDGEDNVPFYLNINLLRNTKYKRQAGAELGQAQRQLELGFTLIKACCIILMITNYHYISLSTIGVNFVTSTYLH